MSAGTTLVAVSVVDGYMQFISVGDSKIYVLRNGQLRTMNREHNYYLILDEQYRRGEITQDDYLREGARGEALISYLGMGNISIMDANPIPISLIDGDIIILCSDGLYKSLSEEQIAAIIRKILLIWRKPCRSCRRKLEYLLLQRRITRLSSCYPIEENK